MATVHVTPIGDEREHVPAPWCWCEPWLSPEEPDDPPDAPPVYVHNSADMREEYERVTGESYKGKLWLCTTVDDDGNEIED